MLDDICVFEHQDEEETMLCNIGKKMPWIPRPPEPEIGMEQMVKFIPDHNPNLVLASADKGHVNLPRSPRKLQLTVRPRKGSRS
jgi:hypothetical protein